MRGPHPRCVRARSPLPLQWEGSCGPGTQGRGSPMREGGGSRQLEATVVICGALEGGATTELGLGGWVPRCCFLVCCAEKST